MRRSDVDAETVLAETVLADTVLAETVPLAVDRITARFPDQVAVADESTALTYRELTAAADRVARVLIEHGTKPGDLVALALSRSVGYPAAMLGVLRAGAAYLPVDPDEPVARTRATLASVQARVLLTDGAARFGLGVPQVFVTATGPFDPPAEPRPTAVLIGGDSPCYAMFTSGTTGRPKGVVVPHRAVTSLACRPRFVSLAPGSVLLALAPLHFDAATFEIWGPLCNGATVVMAPRPVVGAGELRELIKRHRVNVLHLTAGLFRVLADEEPDCFTGLDWLLTGGDVVPAGPAADVARRLPRLGLLACYGPTEGTTFTSVARLTGTGLTAGPVPLGEPLPGRRMEILDARLRPVKDGGAGELYVGGVGLALGYLGRAAETAERFVPDPRPVRPGERLYRTGDLARRKPDGAVEFLGRSDDQVKIRGVRVEPAEVAAALAGHPDVRDAVVVACGPAGEATLAAYLTTEPGRRPGDRALRDFLGAVLPAAMIPSEFVTVDRFPVTAQGKVDRAALARARPVRLGGVAREPAVASIDELVLQAWREFLDRETGPDDNVFELGGHSLMALRVAARLERALGRPVPVRLMFEHPTARDLARWLEASAAEHGPRGDHRPRSDHRPPAGEQVPARLAADLHLASPDEIARIRLLLGSPVPDDSGALAELAAHPRLRPLSAAQRALWFLENFHPNSSFYVVGFGLLLTGPLDAEALDGALRACARRHEALRARFVTLDGHPYQVFTGDEPARLTPVDLSGQPAHRALAELRQRFDALAGRPFNLTAQAPLRAELVRLPAGRHALLLAIHHIVFDAWSSGLLLSELAAGYSALTRGERYEPAPPRPSFGEMAQRQAPEVSGGSSFRNAVAHWRRLLADAPRLELPTDLARPRRRGFTGAVTAVDVDAGTSRAVRRLAGQLNVSPFVVLAAAFSLLLAYWSGQSDLVIGVPMAGRADPDTHELIGFFTSTLPLRVDLTAVGSFREAVLRLRGPALDLLSQQDLPFPLLVDKLGAERAGNRNPLYDVTFQHLPALEAGARFDGLTMELLSSDWHTAQFDLSCDVLDAGEEFRVQCEFSTELFTMTTIRGQLDRYVALLREAVADPARLPRSSPVPGGQARSEVRQAWAEGGLAGLISARAASTPDAEAVRCRDASLSFGALDRAAGRLAGALAAAGVRSGDRVGLLLEPALDVPAAILAVLRLGAAYVPVDPHTPSERAAVLLRTADCRVVVGHQHVPAAAGLDVTFIDPAAPGSAGVAEGSSPLASTAPAPAPVAVSPGTAAYVMFTSGSTGQPKPVVVTHRAAMSLAAAAASVYQLTPADVVAQISSLAVDVSVEELFAAWHAGASVALAPASLAALADPGTLVRECGVTVLNLAAPGWHGWVRSLADAGERIPRTVRLVVTGSDKLDPDLVRAWSDGPGRGIRLLNAYGTTETTVSSAWYDTAAFPVDARHTRTVPIGAAFPHACLHVLDERLDPVPDGVPGELYVGGPGVALGYLRQPAATAVRFIPDSCAAPGGRMYRTGDRVRRLPTGALEFIGRTDDQVQVNGYRIELGEVESAAATVPGVAEFVAAARADGDRAIRLVGYVRASCNAGVSTSARIDEWRAIHDAELFNEAAAGTDPALHTGGWLSSFTMAPIPVADMREWRDATVARLLADDLDHVVEIGCGTGMILLEVAQRAQSYLGTDISPRALEYVRAQLPGLGLADGRVRLAEAAAHDLTALDGVSPDLLVLNSVIQYFPGADYLDEVLTAAWHRLRPGGRLFVGDVRDLRSLRLFHASVLAARTAGGVSPATLAGTAAERADTDGELCVDPRYFHALAGRWPDLAAIDVQVKRGRADTEMNRHRYDVTLWRAPVPGPVATGLPIRDGSGLDAAALAVLLARLDGAGAVLAGMPDGRITPGVHPDDIREIAARAGYACAVRPASLGRLDVTLLPEPGRPDLAAPDPAAAAADRAALTNDPLQASRQRQVADAIYTRLRAVLPGPMVPGQLVFVPEVPRTPSGKVDRGRLPDPPAYDQRTVPIPPRTELERLLCAAWERALRTQAVGIRDNFFAIGGDSLTWLHLVSRLNRLGVRCEVREIFDHQTVEELARAISARNEPGGEQ